MASAGLNFFRVPPVDFRFEARRYVHYCPVYQGIEPITFHVPATDDYMDIKEAKLIIKVRLKNSEWTHGHQDTNLESHFRWHHHQQLLDRQ